MRILVTGGLGFIGRHLCEALALAEHTVLAFDNTVDAAALRHSRDLTYTYPKLYRYVPGSIRDAVNFRAALINHTPAVVIHLAALPGVRSSVLHPLACMETNVQGTTIVLETCREQGVSKVLFASSSSVYGHPRAPERASCEEDAHDFPLSPYAASKRAGELLCATYASLHTMDLTALRFFSVYGPHQRADLALPIFAKQLLAGAPLQVLGDGAAKRDYTYIADCVAGILLALAELMATPPSGRYACYNLGSGAPITVRTLMATLQVVMGLTASAIEYLPAHRADTACTWADIRKAQRQLGYSPRMPFLEGVRRYVAWRTTPG